MVDKSNWAVGEDEEEDQPTPGQQPILQELPPIDHAPVAALTEPEDTEGG